MAAAFEQLALEIGAQAEAQHRYALAVHHLGQLEHLVAGQELCLVDQHAVHVAFLQRLPNTPEQVIVAAMNDYAERFATLST